MARKPVTARDHKPMSRGFAGVSDPRHRALVMQAIENRVREGVPRDRAAAEVLDREYRRRAEELAAARYSPVDDFFAQVAGPALGRAARLIRRRSRN
jgi:hypothetical protein